MSGKSQDFQDFIMQQFGLTAAGAKQGHGTASMTGTEPMAMASRWLTYCNSQVAENMQVAMALSNCTDPSEAVALWTKYFENSQRHFAEATAAMSAPMTGTPAPTPRPAPKPKAAAPSPAPAPKPAPAPTPAPMPASAKPVAKTAPAKPTSDPKSSKPKAAAPAKTSDDSSETPPARLKGPRQGLPNDLKQISGIGPLLEKKLNSLGLFHFDQLAELTPANIRWIDSQLRFRGRVERERWVEQAKMLAAEGQPARANGAVEHTAGPNE
ncbi:MAG: hypothetical protein AAFY56_05675 [Pseudomonadota bacterium]